MSKKRAGDLQAIPGGGPTEWERMVCGFEASMQASGLSFRTVEHYSDVLLRVLLGYCTRNEIEPPGLTKRDLERLSAELFQAGRSRQSVKTYMSAINRFLKCAPRRRASPASAAPSPRSSAASWTCSHVRRSVRSRKPPRLSATSSSCASWRTPASGWGSCCNLRVGDLVVDGRERYLRVVGQSQGGGAKGDSSRLVPITPGLYMRLDR